MEKMKRRNKGEEDILVTGCWLLVHDKLALCFCFKITANNNIHYFIFFLKNIFEF